MAKRKRAEAKEDQSSGADAAWVAASQGANSARVAECARALLSELWRHDPTAAEGILDRCLVRPISQRKALEDLRNSTCWILYDAHDINKAIGHLKGESVNETAPRMMSTSSGASRAW